MDIKPKVLKIQGFGSYQSEQEITFSGKGGVNLVTGRNEVDEAIGANGAGKSTIWEALTWCLFGRTSRGLKSKAIVNRCDENVTIVTVDIEVDREAISIRRTQNPNSIVITRAFSDPLKATQDEIEALLGFGFEVWVSAFYRSQFSLCFLDLKPAERLSMISTIVGLDVWDKCYEESKKQKNLLKIKIGDTLNSSDRESARAESYEEVKKNLEVQVNQATDADIGPEPSVVYWDTDDDDELHKTRAICSQARATISKNHRQIKIEKSRKRPSNCPTCKRPYENSHECEKALTNTIETLETAIKSLEKELDFNEAKLGPLIAEKEAHDKTISEHRTWSEKKVEYEGKKAHTKIIQGEIDKINSSIEISNSLKTAFDEKASALESEYAVTSEAVDYFKDLRFFAIKSACHSLQISANCALNEMGLEGWEFRLTTEQPNSTGGVKKGIFIEVISPSNDTLVPWECWSGGESQRLRLAVSVGFSDQVKHHLGLKFDFEIWDEPTVRLDEDGVSELYEFLHQRGREGVEVWVVEHRGLGSIDCTDSVVVSKTSSGSRITQNTGARLKIS